MNANAAKFFFMGVLVFICLSLLAPYFGLHILTDAPHSPVGGGVLRSSGDQLDTSDSEQASEREVSPDGTDSHQAQDNHQSSHTRAEGPVEQLLMQEAENSSESAATKLPQHDSLAEVERILGQ